MVLLIPAKTIGTHAAPCDRVVLVMSEFDVGRKRKTFRENKNEWHNVWMRKRQIHGQNRRVQLVF